MAETEEEYIERAAMILPDWTFWGEGIVLVKKEHWLKSESKIEAILKQLHRAKLRVKDDKEIVALKAENNRLRRLCQEIQSFFEGIGTVLDADHIRKAYNDSTTKAEIEQALKGK